MAIITDLVGIFIYRTTVLFHMQYADLSLLCPLEEENSVVLQWSSMVGDSPGMILHCLKVSIRLYISSSVRSRFTLS